jgi:hypothetical protein
MHVGQPIGPQIPSILSSFSILSLPNKLAVLNLLYVLSIFHCVDPHINLQSVLDFQAKGHGNLNHYLVSLVSSSFLSIGHPYFLPDVLFIYLLQVIFLQLPSGLLIPFHFQLLPQL